MGIYRPLKKISGFTHLEPLNITSAGHKDTVRNRNRDKGYGDVKREVRRLAIKATRTAVCFKYH